MARRGRRDRDMSHCACAPRVRVRGERQTEPATPIVQRTRQPRPVIGSDAGSSQLTGDATAAVLRIDRSVAQGPRRAQPPRAADVRDMAAFVRGRGAGAGRDPACRRSSGTETFCGKGKRGMSRPTPGEQRRRSCRRNHGGGCMTS